MRIKLFKVIVSVSVVMIALLTLSPTQIGATSTKNSILKENEVENSIQNTFVRKIAVKGVYYLLNKSTQALAKKTPTITLGKNFDSASSGKIKFGKIGSVRKNIKAVKKGHRIALWAKSHQIGWTGKIVVTLSRPNSSKDAINRTVTHNQYSFYTVQKAGTHVARWSTPNSHAWTLWQGYFHWGDLNKKCDSKGNCMLPSNIASPYLHNKENNVISAMDENGNKASFEIIDNYIYMIPSENHINRNAKLETQNKSSSPNTVTMNELYYEYYDENIGQKVDVSKNYVAGDQIIVTDTIIGLKYDTELNATLFEFDSDNGSQYLAFNGNLTKKYNIGDIVSFKFNIVSLHEGHEYTTIDYTKVTNDGTIPKIEEYLVK